MLDPKELQASVEPETLHQYFWSNPVCEWRHYGWSYFGDHFDAQAVHSESAGCFKRQRFTVAPVPGDCILLNALWTPSNTDFEHVTLKRRLVQILTYWWWWSRVSCSRMSVDILGTNCDQCRSTVQCCFTSTETVRLIRTGSPGRPPRLSHSSWTLTCLIYLPLWSTVRYRFQRCFICLRLSTDFNSALFTSCLETQSDQILTVFYLPLWNTVWYRF